MRATLLLLSLRWILLLEDMNQRRTSMENSLVWVSSTAVHVRNGSNHCDREWRSCGEWPLRVTNHSDREWQTHFVYAIT
jgi:hypothetical protein